MNIKEIFNLIEKEKNIKIRICNADKINLKIATNHLSKTPYVSYSTDERLDPKVTMNECNSVVMVAVPYKKVKRINRSELSGQFSDNCIGNDYHNKVISVLKELKTLLHNLYTDTKTEIYCDTGPLLERAFAVKSGIGFIGENGLVISDEFGSYFNIGYMLTNIKIEEDESLENKSCIQCGLCKIKCPTNSIGDNKFKINFENCISNLTQTKDDISYKNINKMGTSLYGCDICQKICPHNSNVDEVYIDYSKEEDIQSILDISNKDYKKLYKDTNVFWRGKKILQRNALIALHNTNSITAKEILKNYKDDRELIVNLLEKIKK